MIIILILIAASIFKLFTRLDQTDVFPSEVVGVCVLLLTYMLSSTLLIIERRCLVHTSPIQFYFWLLHCFCSIPSFAHSIERLTVQDYYEVEDFISALSATPLISLMLILYCISDHVSEESDTKTPPEDKSSHLSFILFGFMDSLIWKGYRHPLLQSELPSNPQQVNVEANVNRFLRDWNNAITKKGVSMVRKGDGEEKTVGIWWVLIRAYGSRMVVCTLLAILYTFISFVNPLVLDALIKHVQNQGEAPWKGYFFITVLLVSNLVKTISSHLSLHHLVVVGQQMRSSVVSAIYR